MALQQAKKSKAKGRKIGRNEKKCQSYKNAKRREKNKLKRVLKSNGIEAAKTYAEMHGLKI